MGRGNRSSFLRALAAFLAAALLTALVGAASASAASVERHGGMNLDGYCASIGESGSTLKAGTEAWICLPSEAPLNLQAACEHEYKQRPITAKEEKPKVPFS
jgi:hypothetical protein